MSPKHPAGRSLFLLVPLLLAPFLLAGPAPLLPQEAHELFPVRAHPLLMAGGNGEVASEVLPFLASSPTPAPTPLVLAADRRRRGTTFMIAGAVAVVVGSVIGGDGGTLILVGGLVSVGYGFYLYHDP